MENQKLTDFYPWDEASDLQRNVILCLDSGGSNQLSTGEFTWLYLLMKLLKHNIPVVLISTNHARVHYEAILRKNGLDLNKLEHGNNIIIKYLTHVKIADSSSWDDIETLSNELLNKNSIENELNEKLFSIVIDDLEMFELLSPSLRAARKLLLSYSMACKKTQSSLHSFIAYGRQCNESHEFVCGDWCPSTVGHENSSSTVGGDSSRYRNNTLDGEGGGTPVLSEYMRYRADVTIHTSPLSTGHSLEVHGSIAVSDTQQSCRRRLLLLYKALDSGVRASLVGNTTGSA